MTEFCLIRHGQTDWNQQGRWQGQSTDAPGLNENGFAQARSIKDELDGQTFDAIYASPLRRAKQTAELVAEPLGLVVNYEPRLREINLGIWEGMLSDDISEGYSQEMEERASDPYHYVVPGGESPEDVARRVSEAVDEIAAKHPGQSILIVAHGVSLAVIYCKAEGIPLEKVYEHIPENAKPYYVKWG